jgi:hypothetical protein
LIDVMDAAATGLRHPLGCLTRDPRKGSPRKHEARLAARCDLRNNQEPTQRENLLARHYLFVTDLERSNNELRAALILAGKEIRKLNFGKSDTPLLQKLREVLRESRIVAARERQKVRLRLS